MDSTHLQAYPIAAMRVSLTGIKARAGSEDKSRNGSIPLSKIERFDDDVTASVVE
jgi:hypothetical protein